MVQVIYLEQVYHSSITCKLIAGLPDDKEVQEDRRTDDVTNNLHFLIPIMKLYLYMQYNWAPSVIKYKSPTST